MKCLRCSSEIPEGSNFCTGCGQPVDNPTFRETSKNIETSGKKMWLNILKIIVLVVLGMCLAIFALIAITVYFSLDSSVAVIGSFVIVIGGVTLELYFLMRGSFAKKDQIDHYNTVINSNFTDDTLLERNLLNKLRELGFKRDESYPGKTYSLGLYNNSSTKTLRKCLRYFVKDGKIYLEAWLKWGKREYSPAHGFVSAVYKKQFMDEIGVISNYFDFK